MAVDGRSSDSGGQAMRRATWSPVWVVALVLALAACGGAPAPVATGTAPSGQLAMPAGPTATPTVPGTGGTTGPSPSTHQDRVIDLHPAFRTGETTGPPPSTLTAAGQTQTGDLGSFCWPTLTAPRAASSATPPPSPEVCLEVDGPGLPVPEERLPVTAGDTAVFRLGGTTPPAGVMAAAFPLAGWPLSEVGGRRWVLASGAPPPPKLDLPTTLAGHEATIVVAVPAGAYVVLVRVSVLPDGGALYGFHVVVLP